MTNDDRSLVKLQGAGVLDDGRWLVRGVDMEVCAGEIVTLIGPNGSGKSTTAKMALGLRPLSEGKRQSRSNLRIGYVPQKLSIDWTLPLDVARFMELTQKLSRDKTLLALERTGVAHQIDASMQHLSGGEFQRVLLARALAKQPDLMVLDEPVQGVDFGGEIELYELIDELRHELNCGILLISHDLHLVMASTDRVICLNGHMCCQGTPQSVAESPEYQNLFGAHGASALAVYQHHHDHTHLPDGRVMHADGCITETCDPHNHDLPVSSKGDEHVG